MLAHDKLKPYSYLQLFSYQELQRTWNCGWKPDDGIQITTSRTMEQFLFSAKIGLLHSGEIGMKNIWECWSPISQARRKKIRYLAAHMWDIHKKKVHQ